MKSCNLHRSCDVEVSKAIAMNLKECHRILIREDHRQKKKSSDLYSEVKCPNQGKKAHRTLNRKSNENKLKMCSAKYGSIMQI